MPHDRERSGETSPHPDSESPDTRSFSPSRSNSPIPSSLPRHIVTARLASPVPFSVEAQEANAKQLPTPKQLAADKDSDFRLSGVTPASLENGRSILGNAFQDRPDLASSVETSQRYPASPAVPGSTNENGSNSGANTFEDPEVVQRHLVQPQNEVETDNGNGQGVETDKGGNDDDDAEEFSSLKLQGGDITRQVYRWTEAEMQEQGSRRRRSFHLARPEPEAETLDINSIRVPGGFRRDYLRRAGGNVENGGLHGTGDPEQGNSQQRLPTNNFLEFLTLFGHFAGEELEEDDEVLGPDEYFYSDRWARRVGREGEGEPSEETALLPPGTPGKHPRKPKERATKATNSATGAILLLLKSFVGTGVLFLPRAFLNGGMLFSSCVLVVISALSYYCFILLVRTRVKVDGSFGDLGEVLYGKYMRKIILASIALSQFGFVSAYLVFVSANLQAFILAVSECETFMSVKFLILIQLIIFLPLSLIRDITKLAFTALIADFFILLGLIYLYGFGIKTIAETGVADIHAFNPSSWTLLIGTAIFSYEGIGLVIPIQESMKRPEKFPWVLGFVMIIITSIFLSMGIVGYATFGSATETVVILNLPQDDKFVMGIQFLYAVAILLSTPLQLFPAIRILENGLFTRSGKYNPGIKWKKNIFRFFLVVICGLIAWGGAGDLDKFVALVGSFACVPLVYVYPPLLHLKALATTRRQRIADITLAVFGIVGCLYTTALTINNWAAGGGEKQPGHCDL